MSTGRDVEHQAMSPRPYRAGERRLAATKATRSKIVSAARDLLSNPATASFSIDAVAERADVARMTVYYQFKSKGKLLEALFDDVAARANMRDMRKVFRQGDPYKALNLLIEIFCRMWNAESSLLRRLNALAALDPDVDMALSERDEWRRKALGNILDRLPGRQSRSGLVDLLHALTSFDTYKTIAANQNPKYVVRLLQKAAAALVHDALE